MLTDHHAEATYGFNISTSLREAQNKKLLQVRAYILVLLAFHKSILW